MLTLGELNRLEDMQRKTNLKGKELMKEFERDSAYKQEKILDYRRGGSLYVGDPHRLRNYFEWLYRVCEPAISFKEWMGDGWKSISHHHYEV